jgi:hypothetical protein
MRLIPRPIYERKTDVATPFSEDTLGRETTARNITRLLKISSDGLVITIDGRWGEGKTSLIKFWIRLLENDKNFIPIYYDAFQHDFTGDPFVSLSAAIYEGLRHRLKDRSNERNTQSELKHLRKTSKELAVGLAKMTAGIAVSHFTGGFLNSELITEWAKDAVEKVTFDTLEAKADQQFEAYLHSQDAIRSYQETITDLLRPEEAQTSQKLVIFVDELDRCRPLFAVEILEKIKHFFNIKGVFFILSINKEQLLRTISSVYGIGDEAAIYLHKFVDIEARLPEIGRGVLTSEQEVIRHFQKLAEELSLADGPLSIMSEIRAITDLIPTYLKINARSIEKAISLMAIGLHSCRTEDAIRLKSHIVISSLIRVAAPDYYSQIHTEGNFFEDHKVPLHQQLFNWAKKYFALEKEDKALNVFVVPAVKEACRILDLYEIPGIEGDRYIPLPRP